MIKEYRKAQEGISTLLFSTLYPSEARPGHGLFVEARLMQLLRTGAIRSRVVAPVPWFPSKSARFGQWASWADTPRYERRDCVEVWHPRYLLPPKLGMNIAPLMLALGARNRIARLINTGEDFDLFDAHYYYPDGAAAAILSFWFNKPLIVTGRGTDLNVLPDYAIPRRWIKWTERRAIASVLVSRALKDRLHRLGGDPDKMYVLPNGVDLAFFRPLNREECRDRLRLGSGRWILSVGNLLKAKGHDVAIESLGMLPNDVRLAIIGEGEDHSRLERLAKRCPYAHRITLTGLVPQSELVYWYNAADALVLASSREGSPNVVLEALACGTPVAATAVGGLPDIVTRAIVGRLIEERTPSALASAVNGILASATNREAVRTHASAFSWAETTRAQIELFRNAKGTTFRA